MIGKTFIASLLLLFGCISYEDVHITNTAQGVDFNALDKSLQYLSLTLANVKKVETNFANKDTIRYKLLYFDEVNMKVLIISDSSKLEQYISFASTDNALAIYNAEKGNIVFSTDASIPVNSYYLNIYSKIKTEILEASWQNSSNLRISGFGVGGVMATLLALEMRGIQHLASLHTFGTTPFTTQDATIQIQRSIGHIMTNVMHENDIALTSDINNAALYSNYLLISETGGLSDSIVVTSHDYSLSHLRAFYQNSMISRYSNAIKLLTKSQAQDMSSSPFIQNDFSTTNNITAQPALYPGEKIQNNSAINPLKTTP